MNNQRNHSLVCSEQLFHEKMLKNCLMRDDNQEINIHWSCLSPRFLLMFRAISFVILTLRFSIEPYLSFFTILEYLSDLGFCTTWIYFTLVCFDFVINVKMKLKISPQLGQWMNLLFQIAFCYQFPITIIEWLLLFDYDAQNTSWDIIKNFGIHGLPLICLTIDFVFNVNVFPLKHLLVVLAYGIVYLFINLGYSLTNGIPVYDPIDWVSFQSYVWILACLIVVLVVHRGSQLVWTKKKLQRIKDIRSRFDESQSSLAHRKENF